MQLVYPKFDKINMAKLFALVMLFAIGIQMIYFGAVKINYILLICGVFMVDSALVTIMFKVE